MPSSLEKKEFNSKLSLNPLNADNNELSKLSESISDAVDNETIEALTMKDVSEISSSGKENKSSSSLSGNTSTKIIRLPSPNKMRVDVKRKIQKEILVLTKKAKYLEKNVHKKGNSYKFSILMRKLRKLKHLLNNIVSFSADQVRNLWFRFVKGE